MAWAAQESSRLAIWPPAWRDLATAAMRQLHGSSCVPRPCTTAAFAANSAAGALLQQSSH